MALILLFSSATERLSDHAEAKMAAGTHFLVGSGIDRCFLLEGGGNAMVGLEEDDSGRLMAHRSVFSSWKRFPLELEATLGSFACCFVVGLGRRALEAELVAEAAARFKAAIPEAEDGI